MSKYREPGDLCTVDGCDREAVAREWCHSHWSRWRRTGDPGPPFRPRNPDFCCILGCGRPCRALGMCDLHHRRWKIHGDPFHEREYPKGKDHPYWAGDDVTYTSAHFRVLRDRGPASSRRCSECGDPAKHWAYDHADPNERRDERGIPYSPDSSHYRPMCVPCHKHFDLNWLESA